MFPVTSPPPLATLIWDRFLGTYRDPTHVSVRDGDVGIAGHRSYRVGYIAQLLAPFRPRRQRLRWSPSSGRVGQHGRHAGFQVVGVVAVQHPLTGIVGWERERH